jgi:hypothetical protein
MVEFGNVGGKCCGRYSDGSWYCRNSYYILYVAYNMFLFEDRYGESIA